MGDSSFLRNPRAKENLVDLSKRNEEERKKIQSMGGIASGIAKKKRRLMREILEDKLLLTEAGDKLTYQEKATLGLIKGAIDGKAENYKTILEVLGELGITNGNETPSVSINIIDNSALEKALYDENRKEE